MAGYNPQYKVNLPTVFNYAYSDESTALRNALRPIIANPVLKRVYSKKITDRIIERTQDKNIDKNDRPLRKYSPDYVSSLVFKIYGKSAGDVNLTLTGEMLASIRSNFTSNEIVFSFADQFNKDKAHGHITGRLGRSTKRDFFGLPRDEEAQLLKESVKAVRGDSFDLLSAIAESSISLPFQIGAQEATATVDLIALAEFLD